MNTLKFAAYVLSGMAVIAFIAGMVARTDLYSGDLAQLSINTFAIYCFLKVDQMESRKAQ